MNVDLAFVKPLFIRSFIWAFILVCFCSVITGQGALAYTEEHVTTVGGSDAGLGSAAARLYIHNMTQFALYNPTKIVWTTDKIRFPTAPTFTHNVTSGLYLYGGSSHCHVVFTVDNVDSGHTTLYDSSSTFTYELSDCEWTPNTGTVIFVLSTSPTTGEISAWEFVGWNNPTYNYVTTSIPSGDGDVWRAHPNPYPFNGVTTVYSGSDCVVPTAEFAADNVYTNKDAVVTFTDLSTGSEPFTYLWDFDDVNYNTEIVEHTFEEWGDYNVSLKVTNDCGFDWENKTDYIHVQMFQNWTPTPTVVSTYIPWTNVTFFNMTEYRQDIEDNPLIGNMTTPVLDLFDDVLLPLFDFFQLFSGFMSFPFTTVTQYLATVTGIFDDIMPEFMGLMSVPLVITGKVINMIPYQVQMVITLAIIFDIILLIVRGE